MKSTLSIALLLLSLLLYDSCSDSLGIEPNVLKKRLDTNKIDTTKIDTTKKPPSVKIAVTVDSLYFWEEFFKDTNNVYRVPFQTEVIKRIVFVDTSKSPPYVWIDLSVLNKNDEVIYHLFDRTIYTKEVQFAADSFPATGKYRLNGSPNSGFWSEVACKYVNEPDILYFSGGETRFEINFDSIANHAIYTRINAKIPNKMPDDRILILTGIFRINLP